MTNHQLTDVEEWMVACIHAAEAADFSQWPAERREISAEVIRRLMLEQPVKPDKIIKVSGIGIRLKYATIRGVLSLEHGSLADGSPMPKLSLEQCDISEGINLKSAKIQRLCLKDARLSELIADYAHIDGLLDVRGLSGHPEGPSGAFNLPLCRINLCGAHIEGGIEAGGACLVGLPDNPGYKKYSGRAPYALDLPETTINGDLRLFPDFVATGGISINGAVINGSLQAHGATVTAVQLYALDASGADIRGSLALDSRVLAENEHMTAQMTGLRLPGAKRFECNGQLRLNNIIIREDLRLHGARIDGAKGRVTAQNVTVHGDANLCAFDDAFGDLQDDSEIYSTKFPPTVFPFVCKGRIDLRGADIGGDLNFRGAILGGDTTSLLDTIDGELDVSSSHIGGHLLFSPMAHLDQSRRSRRRNKTLTQRFVSGAHIKLDGTEVTGNLDMRGAWLRGDMQAYGLKIQGYANLAPYVFETLEPSRFRSEGKITLDSAVIGQKLDLSGAHLKKQFLAPNIQIGSKLFMSGYASNNDIHPFLWFDADERVNLSGATIRGDFDLTAARLCEGMRFRGGRVNSALIIDVFDAPANENLAPENRVSIDLFNAHANILLDLHSFRKPGEDHDTIDLGYDESYFLRLEGFTYSRFPHYADNESIAADEKERRDRLHMRLAQAIGELPPVGKVREDLKNPRRGLELRTKWLTYQYRGRKPKKQNYNPDPYNTLYKFFKRMGAQSLADDVLHNKLNIECEVRIQPSMWLYRIFLGYGLRPWRPLKWYAAVTIGFFTATWFLTAVPAGCDNLFLPTLVDTLQVMLPSFELVSREECARTGAAWSWLELSGRLFGWVMAPLTVLAWTGFLRRNAEPQ